MSEFQFGRGRKPFTHNFSKRLRSQSVLEEQINEDVTQIQDDFTLDEFVDEALQQTAFEPIINLVQCPLPDSVQLPVPDSLNNAEADTFFTDYLMGAIIVQGNAISVSNSDYYICNKVSNI